LRVLLCGFPCFLQAEIGMGPQNSPQLLPLLSYKIYNHFSVHFRLLINLLTYVERSVYVCVCVQCARYSPDINAPAFRRIPRTARADSNLFSHKAYKYLVELNRVLRHDAARAIILDRRLHSPPPLPLFFQT
jgi:hypothetical protein